MTMANSGPQGRYWFDLQPFTKGHGEGVWFIYGDSARRKCFENVAVIQTRGGDPHRRGGKQRLAGHCDRIELTDLADTAPELCTSCCISSAVRRN